MIEYIHGNIFFNGLGNFVDLYYRKRV